MVSLRSIALYGLAVLAAPALLLQDARVAADPKTVVVPKDGAIGECSPSPANRVAYSLTAQGPINGAYIVDPSDYDRITSSSANATNSFFSYLVSFSCDGHPTITKCDISTSTLFAETPINKCLLIVSAGNTTATSVNYDIKWGSADSSKRSSNKVFGLNSSSSSLTAPVISMAALVSLTSWSLL
ncbi:MAG: hypothetical protein DHS80DRAFT_21690 [Piptocephalis tieghemiana]|nr:MAG: hypothetical protein DHS80DRAFT_21690 [Piptocephalis tieghemiana]